MQEPRLPGVLSALRVPRPLPIPPEGKKREKKEKKGWVGSLLVLALVDAELLAELRDGLDLHEELSRRP